MKRFAQRRRAGTRRRSDRAAGRAHLTVGAVLASALVAVTVVATPATQAASGPPAPRSAATQLMVGTFNVYKGGSKLPTTGARLDRIASEVRRGNFDVVAVQEAAKSMRDSIAARLSPTYSHSLAKDSRGNNYTGEQIFYRPQVLQPGKAQGVIELPTNSARLNFAIYQEFYHRATGARFLFAGVHLFNGGGRAASDLRYRQTSHVLETLRQANTDGLPVVIVGDVNSHSGSKYVYDAPRQVLQSGGLSEVFDRAAVKVNASYNSFNFLTRTPARKGYRPDQIYVSGGIAVQYVETMVRTVTKKKKVKKKIKKVTLYRTPFTSDHNPVRSIVIIPAR